MSRIHTKSRRKEAYLSSPSYIQPISRRQVLPTSQVCMIINGHTHEAPTTLYRIFRWELPPSILEPDDKPRYIHVDKVNPTFAR